MLSLYLAAIDTAEEKSKFELLYQRYRDIMYWAAYGIMKDPHQAGDVGSQSFFKVIDHLNRITDVDSRQTKAFLVTITEHTAIDCYRKRKRERTVSMEDWEAVSSYTEEFEENDVISCINSLPVNYAVVLKLRYSQGYSDEEIAQILHITKENVRTRVKRGKRKLEEMLRERGIEF